MAVMGNIQNMSPVGPSASSSSRRREQSAASSWSLSLAAIFEVARGASGFGMRVTLDDGCGSAVGSQEESALRRERAQEQQDKKDSHGRSGTNFMRKNAAACEAVLGPCFAVVLRHVECFLVDAGVNAPG